MSRSHVEMPGRQLELRVEQAWGGAAVAAGTSGDGDGELKPAKGVGKEGEPEEVAPWAGGPPGGPCTTGTSEENGG